MRTLTVIGIGTGNPDHLTLEGVRALGKADRVFVPTKGEEKAALAAVRHQICARHLRPGARTVEFALPVRDAANPDYGAGVDDWHHAIALQYGTLLAQMGEEENGAFLVWGDPSLYDSTLRILGHVRALGGPDFTVRVVPGVTAVQVLTAAFAIPLNTIGNPITITTGRRLSEEWPEGADSVVVMLDGRQAFSALDPQGIEIHWGAYVGMDEEILISGALAEVRDTIARAHAAARKQHGWIMDIYLLRRV
ncbi:precorrin-6A synthase (deacetylating) [Pelagibacterium montanilacus]|uniref:precorrin-6A synthase (deacetylating) n=1 Tax=Pelagibacterium montanilacus TaxID=2185280 RepID=UPI000F8D8BD2|nr:precorrin-6A synthase (deacetylating) [Pelagibacterium montanilacus]